jgi:hypothetical protein
MYIRLSILCLQKKEKKEKNMRSMGNNDNRISALISIGPAATLSDSNDETLTRDGDGPRLFFFLSFCFFFFFLTAAG